MRASVAFKIFLGFAAVLLAFGLVTGYSIYKMDHVRARLVLISDTYVPLTQIFTQALSVQNREEEFLKGLEENPQFLKLGVSRMLKRLPDDLARAKALLLQAEEPASADDEKMIEKIQERLNDLDKEAASYMEKRNELERRAAAGETLTPEFINDLRGRQARLSVKIDALLKYMQSRVKNATDRAQSVESDSAWIVAILSLIALVIGVGIATMAQVTLRPLAQLSAAARLVGRGEQPARLSPAGQDEIGALTVEFNKMVSSLQARDQKIREKHAALAALTRFHSDIIRSISAGLIVLGKNGVARGANPAAISLFGLDPAQVEGVLLIEMPILGAVPKQFQHQILTEVERVLHGETNRGETLRALPYTIHGKERLIDLRVVPFADAVGDIEGVLLLGEDATEEIRTKEKLIQSERLATVGRMAAQVAHEIRNPLSSIGLNTELLEDDLADISTKVKEASLDLPRLPQDQKLLKSIQNEVDRLTAITEDYLRYARLPQPQKTLGDLNAMVRALCEFSHEEARSRKVELAFTPEPDLPSLRFDESQLRQALLNLLRNAFEAFTGKGSTVKIHTSLQGTFAEIEICDDGPGISPEIAPKIFEPFFSTKSGGTGLGLALTQQVIEGHGGNIRLKTTSSQGTTFLIQIPLS